MTAQLRETLCRRNRVTETTVVKRVDMSSRFATCRRARLANTLLSLQIALETRRRLVTAGNRGVGMNAQFRIDHIALNVRDLSASAKFYGETLGLVEIDNKTRRPTIRWFGFDGTRAIHLITGRDEPPPARPMSAHFCFSTPAFDETLKDMAGKGVKYVNLAGQIGEFSLRADGVRQTYFQDPDNYWIEVCEANADGTVG